MATNVPHRRWKHWRDETIIPARNADVVTGKLFAEQIIAGVMFIDFLIASAMQWENDQAEINGGDPTA